MGSIDAVSGIEIRPLRADEVHLVPPIWDAAGLHYRPEGRDSIEFLEREASDERSFILGAFEAGNLVGAAVGTDDGRKGWINRVAVHPNRARRGIGRALIRSCEAAFRERGIGVFALLIFSDNEASRALFISEGYIERPDVSYLRKADASDDW